MFVMFRAVDVVKSSDWGPHVPVVEANITCVGSLFPSSRWFSCRFSSANDAESSSSGVSRCRRTCRHAVPRPRRHLGGYEHAWAPAAVSHGFSRSSYLSQ